MNPDRARELRLLRAAAIGLSFAAGLVACGGGESTGHGPFVPAPVACDSASASSADGYAIGMCASTATSVFVDVVSPMSVPFSSDGYILTLDFPAALDSNDEDAIGFTAADRTEPAWDRDILGALRGVSYEKPLNVELQAPYVALTDFQGAIYLHNPPWAPPQLQYVHFGTWEKGPTSNEGFVGPWYERPSVNVDRFWPRGSVQRRYHGYVVGVIAPGANGSGYLEYPRSFSAPIEVVVDGSGRIVSAELGTLVMPYRKDKDAPLEFEPLSLDPVSLNQSVTDTPDMALTGSMISDIGPDADVLDGRFEAHYFGDSGRYGHELAGRFRFRTSNGLIAVGSFGAQFVP